MTLTTTEIRRGPDPDRLRLVMLVVVLVVAGLLAWQGSQRSSGMPVIVGPTASSTVPAVPEVGRSLGGVHDVSVVVEPRVGLLDGDLVGVRVEGLANLPGAAILQCAGDVSEVDAAEVCDAVSVEVPASDSDVPIRAAEEQTVSVARTIQVSRGAVVQAYDCAREEAGCVLAVGPYALPPRAVLVRLEFRAVPPRSVDASMHPDSGLRDGDTIELQAGGLRPHATFDVRICAPAPATGCPEIVGPSATSDANGDLRARFTVSTTIYDEAGRIDCVRAGCSVVVTGRRGDRLVELPFRWADGVVAAVPRLSLDPPGPYDDGQTVEIAGSGFPAGYDLGGQIGQCPADKDTAVEERCGYDLRSPLIVGADGSFSSRVRLYASLPITGSCVTGQGCVLAWVIPHGPIATSIPLDFAR